MFAVEYTTKDKKVRQEYQFLYEAFVCFEATRTHKDVTETAFISDENEIIETFIRGEI